MCADVFLKVTEGGEELHAAVRLTVEGGAVVEALMGAQSINSVERLVTARVTALERFDLRVNPKVNLEAV